MDEGNIECHGYGNDARNRLTNDPEWGPLYLDRVRRMVERDKKPPVSDRLVPGQRIRGRAERGGRVPVGQTARPFPAFPQ